MTVNNNDERFDGFGESESDDADSGFAARCGALPTRFPIVYALVQAIMYYVDWGTDVSFAVEVASPNCGLYDKEDSEAPPDGLYIVVIVVMVLHAVSMCAADAGMTGGMGGKGVVLNLLNVRMLHSVYNAVTGDGSGAKAAAKSTNDVKLFEAVIESMPQLHIQYIVLFYYSACLNPSTIYLSLVMSTLSIVFAVTTKFVQLYGRGGEVGFAAATALYFLADTTSRGVAAGMFFGAFCSSWLMLVAFLWVCADLLVQWRLQGDWATVLGGEKYGMRCCRGEHDSTCPMMREDSTGVRNTYAPVTRTRCGHMLKATRAGVETQCELCETKILAGTPTIGCTRCSYHLCSKHTISGNGSMPTLWGTTVAGPYSEVISIPASLLSLFTSLPLSSSDGDRARLFVLSTTATSLMVLASLAAGYGGGVCAATGAGAGAGAGSGSGEAAVAAGTLANNLVRNTAALVFTMLALKMLVYFAFFRSVQKGKGSQESTGFSALFALSTDAASQTTSWTGDDWAAWAKDAANATANFSKKEWMTGGVSESFMAGLNLAGAKCKIVNLR